MVFVNPSSKMGTKMDMIFVSGIWEGTTSPDCG